MNIKFACPHCGQHIEAPRAVIRTAVSCPTCNQEFLVTSDLQISGGRRWWPWILAGAGLAIVALFGAVVLLFYSTKSAIALWAGASPTTVSSEPVAKVAERSVKSGPVVTPPGESDMMLDSELEPNEKAGFLLFRMAGARDGAEFARTNGRTPTQVEFEDYLISKGATGIAAEGGDPRIARRLSYEVRHGFEEGCKGALQGQKPAF